MPQVVWASGEWRSVLMLRQHALTRFVPSTPVCDGRQWAALHATEQEVRGLAIEEGEMFAEQPGERGWAWHPPAFSFSAVLETAAVAFGSFIGPLLPDVGSCGPQVELAPLTARFDPIPTGVVPFQIRQHNVPARAICARSSAGLLVILAVPSRRPPSVIRTSTGRRRCRSMPTT
jgi:hypothetical protein